MLSVIKEYECKSHLGCLGPDELTQRHMLVVEIETGR